MVVTHITLEMISGGAKLDIKVCHFETSLKSLRLGKLFTFGYLWLDLVTLPFLTFPYHLPFLNFPYLSLPFLTFP